MVMNLNPKKQIRAAPPNPIATIRISLNPATYSSRTPGSASAGTISLTCVTPALRMEYGLTIGAVIGSSLNSLFGKAAYAAETLKPLPSV